MPYPAANMTGFVGEIEDEIGRREIWERDREEDTKYASDVRLPRGPDRSRGGGRGSGGPRRKSHSSEASTITPTADRPVECTICSRKFNSQQSLNGHMWVHGTKPGPRGRGRGTARSAASGRGQRLREPLDELPEEATPPSPPPPPPLSPPRLQFADFEKSKPPRLPPLGSKDVDYMRRIQKQRGETLNKIIEKVRGDRSIKE